MSRVGTGQDKERSRVGAVYGKERSRVGTVQVYRIRRGAG